MKNIAVKVLLTDRFQKPKEWILELPAMTTETGAMDPQHAADAVFGMSNMPEHIMPEWMRDVLEKFPRYYFDNATTGTLIAPALIPV